ncbi:MAG: SpoVG family protein [Planctomycetota bacterium]|nr:SpoVG family protein [Planctomycetota bacterium]MDI6787297.1 SpoVG family protein [Planctomycetota bacterium]
MEITEVRIRLADQSSDKLKAFCSITIDNAFVIRDLKIIEGTKGIFVAMPSRKITDHCPKCRGKNPVAAKFCSECGCKLEMRRLTPTPDGRIKLYADIAHPVTTQCRDMIQEKVLRNYQEEVKHSKQPGYKPQEIEDLPSEHQNSL